MDMRTENMETEAVIPKASILQSEISDSYRAWIDDLQEMRKDIIELNRSSEKDFLSIGENLQDFYIRAREISKVSTSATGLIVGEEISNAINGLNDILAQLDDYQKESEDVSEKVNGILLEDILNIIGSIYEPLLVFKKIVKNLRVIGILTRVESSRLSHNRNEFNSLVDDVNKLAQVIESKSENTLSQSEILEELIKTTLVQVTGIRKEQQKKTRMILNDTQSNLEALKEKHRLSSEASKDISICSDKISNSIGEVVSSMQFHDITRQKIEHVEEAFEEVCHKLTEDLENEQGANDPQQRVSSMRSILRLQLGQLISARSEIKEAISNIEDNLKRVAGNASEMSEEIKKVAGSTEKDGSSSLSDIESGIATVTSSLFENIEAGKEFSGAIGTVADTVDKMSVFLSDIQEIGTEIELVALNAGIKAFRTGEEGAALTVLAESIQRLSSDARQRTNVVFDILKQITASAEDLKKGLGCEGDEDNQKIENMANDLETMVRSLNKVSSEVVSLLTGMNEDVEGLAVNIDEAVSGITVHKFFENVLNKVISRLEKLVSDSERIVPVVSEEEENSVLGKFENNYTMDSERAVHQSFLKKEKAGAPLPEPDNGTPFVDIEEVPDNMSGEDDLGDNVELF